MVRRGQKLPDWLVLNSFITNQLGIKDFISLRDLLIDANEGYDEDGLSFFFHRLKGQNGLKIPLVKLEAYDANIRRHMDHINARRKIKIQLRYFQYLAALFTEIYLDHYFNGPGKLAGELEKYTLDFIDTRVTIDPESQYERFIHGLDDLRRVSYWMATGSGKTIILHINYLQFMWYNRGPYKIDFNYFVLITPDERLTAQHLKELKLSGIPSEQFNGFYSTGYFEGEHTSTIEVIDIYKLTEEKSGKGVSVDIESFGNNNIVFVDEAHRGTGGKKWKYFRNELSKDGFTFEYSATIGQAVAGAKPKEMEQEDPFARYAKSILFDYSYPHFYRDGFGKEFRLLNLKKECYDAKDTLLFANLLTFFQQKLVLRMDGAVDEYEISDPLWIFVGNKVNVSNEKSDIMVIVRFLEHLTRNRDWAINTLKDFLNGHSGLYEGGHDLFDPIYPEHRLDAILGRGYNAETLYLDILETVFHTVPGTELTLVSLRGTDGEIGMRYGDNPFFGVIYVGDSSKFLKLVQEPNSNVLVAPAIDHPSLFMSIESPESRINLLVGAKKFGLGWDTYRVSCMGLMRMGQGEGTEIIQLFGRGVRLKGKSGSLKRSTSQDTDRPRFLPIVETLNVFALGADYLETFKGFLDEEGIEVERKSFVLPIKIQQEFLDQRLIVPKMKKVGFEEQSRILLKSEDMVNIIINIIPQVVTLNSDYYKGLKADTRLEPVKIASEYIELLDWDAIYYDLFEYLRQRGYYNVVFDKELINWVLTSGNYTLYCDKRLVESRAELRPFSDLETIENIVLTILKRALVKSIAQKKSAWLMDNMDVEVLTEQHGDFAFRNYCIMVNENEAEIIEAVKKITEGLESYYSKPGGKFITNVYFDRHLYQPLLTLANKNTEKIQIQPTGLVESEERFVTKLRDYINGNPDKFKDNKVFLLRNQPKNGVGFFSTVWFYPDFILWVEDTHTGKHRIIFVDPKGITHLANLDDEKVMLYIGIKDVQARIAAIRGSDDVEMDSYILSDTPKSQADKIFGIRRTEEYTNMHIVFLDDSNCIRTLLEP